MALIQKWRMEYLLCVLDNHTACRAPQPLWGHGESRGRDAAYTVVGYGRDDHRRLSPAFWPRVCPRLEDVKAGLDFYVSIEKGKIISGQESREVSHKLLSICITKTEMISYQPGRGGRGETS